MELEKVIQCLNSHYRRRILQLLCKKDMSAPQIFRELGKEAPSYRQSINKTLEMMRSCGLISKYYDTDNKGIYYHLYSKTYNISLQMLTIKPIEE